MKVFNNDIKLLGKQVNKFITPAVNISIFIKHTEDIAQFKTLLTNTKNKIENILKNF